MEIWRLLVILLVILVAILAVVHGNSATATKLETARKINLTGAVSGNGSFDGSGNIEIATTQANIAILTGDITLESSGGSATINYPSGFTKDNCIIIACGITYNSAGYRAFGTVQASVSTGARLSSSSITVCCYPVQASTGSPTGTFNYKLVLMKIS